MHVKDSASAPQKNRQPGTSTIDESKRDIAPSEPELGQEIDVIEAAPQAPSTTQEISTKKHTSRAVVPESFAPIASEAKAESEEKETKRDTEESLIQVPDKVTKHTTPVSDADPVSPPALKSVQAASISSLGSMPSDSNGGFSISGAFAGFALVVVAIAAITLRAKRQKFRRELLDRDTYKDETPIHLVDPSIICISTV